MTDPSFLLLGLFLVLCVIASVVVILSLKEKPATSLNQTSCYNIQFDPPPQDAARSCEKYANQSLLYKMTPASMHSVLYGYGGLEDLPWNDILADAKRTRTRDVAVA